MCIKPKNTHKMTPDEKTVADYEDRITHLRNIASGQRIVNADLQDKLLKANETIDVLRKEVTELIAKNYELSKLLAELEEVKAEMDGGKEDAEATDSV